MPEKCHRRMAALTSACLFEVGQFFLEASWRGRLRAGVPTPEGLLCPRGQLSIEDTYPSLFPKASPSPHLQLFPPLFCISVTLGLPTFSTIATKATLSCQKVPLSPCANLPATWKGTPLLCDLGHFSLTLLSAPVKIHVTQKRPRQHLSSLPALSHVPPPADM